jgi:D-alanyl-D-alanine carboxypeptidase
MTSSDSNDLKNNLATQLQQTLDISRKDVVGVAAAIATPKASWFGASGVANLNTNTPIQANDRFQIGSITKTFVATVVLQLMEENQLTLDSQIIQWLPDAIASLIPNAQSITIRQLLNHTSGVPDYTTPLLDFGNNLFQEWEPEQLLEFIAGKLPTFAPGESWEYSNSNYILLGLIVEKITGQSIKSEIRDRILAPLELNNTFFAAEEVIPGGFVNGYWDINQDGRLDDLSFITTSIFWSSGSMVSNTQDLLHFGKELFTGDLLQPQTLKQMLTFVDAVGSRAFVKYGLGVAQLRSDKGVIYGHNGLTLGYRANLWYLPEAELFYADLQNSRTTNNFLEPILNTSLPILNESENPSPTMMYNEAVNGDISGDPSAPLVLELQKGTNSLTATSVRGDREYVTLKIPEGFQLDSLVLADYESTDDIAFAAVQKGSVFTEPFRGTNVANLLGYSHFGLNQTGTNILDDLSQGEGAIGFNGALPSGEYTFWLQQTGATATYTLEFNLTPGSGGEPKPTSPYGDAGENTLIGTANDDQLYGNGGNDKIYGKAGNDQLYGAFGNDLLDGGDGKDTLYGNGGSDTLLGGAGNDIIYSGGEDDLINGGVGNDIIYNNGGKDIIVIGKDAGIDTLYNFQFDLDQHISLGSGLTFDQLTLTQTGLDTTIKVGDETLAVLKYLQASSLNSSAFTTT